ncbi:IclR family transcriptional regulator [Marinomonas mediterranea]|jgi:Transcriptional regulator|uniref:Transcriptional regulator, IclR family n=1 Tax=Marinomonas mediterranea (strain ATCC 700492 / JCM 21426 / NBRC 103028 / MMB-1) TaxID=717774 RepID=F2JZQ9_MARM1|nr:IclR family transcriptional regulator C-terminal domain-containing protein [Marinomonas mediterranea]ADZ90913.1 transcriptional regulator, IclR family [Marinomonas mediterranea MMB-1]WCN08957.1 helix-turn-helix domain-containing protein [Marinomonas mediterranea]WCN12989.1 helix-turn-helix domain-containing protein [Marinomonas mediterranea]WCN17058.1 helix-turn-helix domain-containing protein [Marinomonas mediterranea MMB-1]
MINENTLLVGKVALILSNLSSSRKGVRLKTLVLESGIAHASVHRILSDLKEVGFVQQLPDKSYQLGPALFTLGLSAPSPIHDMDKLKEYAQELADDCGDLVYVSLKQLNGVRYIIACKGDSPILPNTIQQGDYKPFTASYSGIVLLSYLDEEQQRSWIHKPQLDAPLEWVDEHRFSLQRNIPKMIKEMKDKQYIYAQDLVLPGVSGISTVIPSKNSKLPYMTVSISATSDRLNKETAMKLVPKLLNTAKKMSTLIH